VNAAVRILGVLALSACLGAAARGGEEAAGAKRPADKVHGYALQQLGREVGVCGTVAVVEVKSAGKLVEDTDRPEIPGDQRWGWMIQQFGARIQRTRCRVVEMLRGQKGVEELSIAFRHFDYQGTQRRLMQARRGQALEEADFYREVAAKEGEQYLVLLALDENLDPPEGEKGAQYSTLRVPLYGPPAEAVKAVREIVKRIVAYQERGEPTAEQGAAAAGHIEALASPRWEKREKAHRALVEMGPVLAGLLEKTGAETRDLEVRLRCAKILEEIKPMPGGEPGDWAGGAVIRKAQKDEAEDEDPDANGDGKKGPLPGEAGGAGPG
jgi:hypothetical protein